MLKVLELFGGIGACSKALQNLKIPFEIVDYVEIDKYVVKSFNAMHDTNFEPQDITTWDKDVEVDLIMHGSPCQDFSLAGKQAGGDKDSGTRSSLMYETIRIVEKLKPKYVIWENVKNLLSKKHIHNFNAYLEKMENIGYKNYYQVLNAKDYGIPQNRERVFTVSILQTTVKECKYEFPKENECGNKIKVVGNYMPSKHDASRIVDENGLAPTVKENHGTVTAVLQRFEFPPKQNLELKLKDILEDEVDEKYYLSEKMINGFNNHNIKHQEKGTGFIWRPKTDEDIANCLRANASLCPTDNTVIRKYGIFDTEKSKHQAGSVYDENGISPTLDTMQGGWRQPCIEEKGFVQKKYENFIKEKRYIPEMFNPYHQKEIKEVAPTQTTCCGSMTSSATVLIGKIEGQSGLKQPVDRDYKKHGVKREECIEFKKDNCSHALRTSVIPYTSQDLRIRKLTPKECWRLMGFDDESFEKAAKVNSNTQLYKQAGNSIVVNVLEAILQNLLSEEIQEV